MIQQWRITVPPCKNRRGDWQIKQQQEPISDTFKYFLQCLTNLDMMDKKYFLQCLKLGLNERSIQLLQPLYEEYEKCRLEDESEERDRKLKDLDGKLTHGSLGVEHFFREMGALYENISRTPGNKKYTECTIWKNC